MLRPALVLATAMALLTACAGAVETPAEVETSVPPSDAGASPTVTVSADACDLPTTAPIEHEPDYSWNGWYSYPQTIETRVAGAEAIVRGVVLDVVEEELKWSLHQEACVHVERAYRSGEIDEGDVIRVASSTPPLIDPIGAKFDARAGYRAGEEYILLLQEDGYYKNTYGSDAPVDYFTWLTDVFPLSTDRSVPGSAPSEDAVSDLLAAVESGPDLIATARARLAEHGLETDGLHSLSITIPRMPDVPGTLIPAQYTAESFPWPEIYRRVQDVARRHGIDWNEITGKQGLLLQGSVYPVEGEESPVRGFLFFVDDDPVLSWLWGGEDVWALSEFEQAAAAEAVSPRSNRAGERVNLVQWFGLDSARSVQVKSGDIRVDGEGIAENLDLLIEALDRELEAHPLGVRQAPAGCSAGNITFELDGGFRVGFEYHSDTNRLYARQDGFYVEAPRTLAQVMGIEPGTVGECPENPPKTAS